MKLLRKLFNKIISKPAVDRWDSKCLAELSSEYNPDSKVDIERIDHHITFWLEDRIYLYDDYNLLLIERLSTSLYAQIDRKYYRRGMRNAHERASRMVRRHARLSYYYSFDAELDEMVNTVKEIRAFKCVKCRDTGRSYGPEQTALQFEQKCECITATDKE